MTRPEKRRRGAKKAERMRRAGNMQAFNLDMMNGLVRLTYATWPLLGIIKQQEGR